MARLPWRTIITSIVGIGLLGVIVFTYFVITTPIPAPSDISRANSTIVYYSDGKTELGRIGEYNRTEVPLSKIPLQLQRAVLAAEDKDFYNHGGFSITGIARAVIGNLTSGFNAGGGSTITQQYAKNAYLTQERSIKRKVKELVLAVKLESSSSKDMILQNYLNVSYMGRGAYGMQTAARVYFAKDVSQLTISESAMLAALLKSPEGFAPEKRLSRLKARWNYVLDQMVDAGWLTESKRKEQQFPIVIDRVNANTLSGPNGYALDMVKRELIGQGYDDATLGIAGMRVVSTFDADAQVAAVRAVEKEGPKSGTDGLRIGLAAVRPGTGEVIAVYGGPDFATEPLNNATQAIGQAGSTFKPFALAAATEAGVGLDTSLPGKSGTVVAGYRVVNYSNESYGPISLLYATEHSVNSAYVTLTYNIGVDAVMNAASRAGIPDNTWCPVRRQRRERDHRGATDERHPFRNRYALRRRVKPAWCCSSVLGRPAGGSAHSGRITASMTVGHPRRGTAGFCQRPRRVAKSVWNQSKRRVTDPSVNTSRIARAMIGADGSTVNFGNILSSSIGSVSMQTTRVIASEFWSRSRAGSEKMPCVAVTITSFAPFSFSVAAAVAIVPPVSTMSSTMTQMRSWTSPTTSNIFT